MTVAETRAEGNWFPAPGVERAEQRPGHLPVNFDVEALASEVVKLAAMRSSRSLLLSVAASSLLFVAGGCAPSLPQEAVHAGDWEAVQKAIAEDRDRGSLSARAMRRLAEMVVERDLLAAPPAEAEALIGALRPCALAAADALERRSRTKDDAGALALIALYEAGAIGRSKLASYVEDDDPALRAAGARVLFGLGDGELRRAAMVHPDERVRRQAARAATHALDAGDAPILLEAGRLDPSAAVRESALRAAGAIGGAAVVQALRDLWATAKEGDRRAIVEAWGMPKSLDAGGLAELRRIAETEAGSPAILAAATLSRLGGESGAAGRSALLRAIAEGPSASRALAIQLAPLDDDGALLALRSATTDPDRAVSLASLKRLVDSPPDRGATLDRLAALAGAGVEAAAIALARAGDDRGTPPLKERLTLAEPKARARAAMALVDAGEWESAAPLLADEAISVRTGLACRLLASD